jgi:putative transposase
MQASQVLSNLRTVMSYDELEQQARASGALCRQRRLHPVRMLEAMLATAGNSGGRLADALRYLEIQYDVKVNRSSFYKRLDETFAKFVHDVMERVMRSATVAENPKLAGKLEGLADLWAWDSTSVTLRRCLARTFAVGAESDRAGAKLHGALSLRSRAIVRPKVTARIVGDGPAIDLGRSLDDVLVLLDRGYSAHKIFASVGDAGGYYLTRLVSGSDPVVRRVHRGQRSAAQNITLDEAILTDRVAMDQVVDLDAELSLDRQESLPARVVGLPTSVEDGTTHMWWYLTNLPRTDYPPELLRELYRLRWGVELLWKQLKGRFRLDDIEAMTEHNVRLVMEVAILSHFLSLGILDSTTTPSERRKLTVGRMALLFPFMVAKLSKLVTTDDEEEALRLAVSLRQAVLHGATDTNPKRSRQAARRRLQNRTGRHGPKKMARSR